MSALDEKEIRATGRTHMLWVGIDRYESPMWPTLKNAVSGSEALEEALQSNFGLDDADVVRLVNQGAALPDIEMAIRAYGPGGSHGIHEDDQLIISFAGHGEEDQLTGETAFVPYDGNPNSPSTWFRFDHLRPLLRVIPARHILVISDSCFSGGVFRGELPTGAGINDIEYAKRAFAKQSRLMISSGGAELTEDGGGRPGRSVFIDGLVHSLRDPDRKWLLANTVFQETRNFVVANAEQTPEYGPLSSSGHAGGEFIFVPKRPQKTACKQMKSEPLIDKGSSPDEFMDRAMEAANTPLPERAKETSLDAGNNSRAWLGFSKSEPTSDYRREVSNANFRKIMIGVVVLLISFALVHLQIFDPDSRPINANSPTLQAESAEPPVQQMAVPPGSSDVLQQRILESIALSPQNLRSFGLLSLGSSLVYGAYAGPGNSVGEFDSAQLRITGSAPEVFSIELRGDTRFSSLNVVDVRDESTFGVVGGASDLKQSNKQGGFVAAYDTSGQVLWETLVHSDHEFAQIEFNSLFQIENDEFIAFGREFMPFSFGEEWSKIFIARFSSNGDLLQSTSVSVYNFEEIGAVEQVGDDRFLLFSETRASLAQYPRLRSILVDSEGRLLGQQRFPEQRFVDISDSVLLPSRDRVLVVGLYLLGEELKPAVWEMTTDGALLNLHTYEETIQWSSLHVLQNGGLVGVGTETCGLNRKCPVVFGFDEQFRTTRVWDLPIASNDDGHFLRASTTLLNQTILLVDEIISQAPNLEPKFYEVDLEG